MWPGIRSKFVMNTLLLNADASPVSFIPLSTISWEDAIRHMVLEKATVLADDVARISKTKSHSAI